ncbi:hypothetical protein [Fulvimarina manganoxydans]|nr:hypothetical protein [Fulvimarina manganoxydans]
MKKFEGIMGYALFTDLSTESEPELVAFGEDVSEIADDYACRRNARAEDCEDWFESPPGTLVAVDTGGDVVVRRAVYDQASDDCFISTEVTARYAWEAA